MISIREAAERAQHLGSLLLPLLLPHLLDRSRPPGTAAPAWPCWIIRNGLFRGCRADFF